jgi:hypothetical protein
MSFHKRRLPLNDAARQQNKRARLLRELKEVKEQNERLQLLIEEQIKQIDAENAPKKLRKATTEFTLGDLLPLLHMIKSCLRIQNLFEDSWVVESLHFTEKRFLHDNSPLYEQYEMPARFLLKELCRELSDIHFPGSGLPFSRPNMTKTIRLETNGFALKPWEFNLFMIDCAALITRAHQVIGPKVDRGVTRNRNTKTLAMLSAYHIWSTFFHAFDYTDEGIEPWAEACDLSITDFKDDHIQFCCTLSANDLERKMKNTHAKYNPKGKTLRHHYDIGLCHHNPLPSFK